MHVHHSTTGAHASPLRSLRYSSVEDYQLLVQYPRALLPQPRNQAWDSAIFQLHRHRGVLINDSQIWNTDIKAVSNKSIGNRAKNLF